MWRMTRTAAVATAQYGRLVTIRSAPCRCAKSSSLPRFRSVGDDGCDARVLGSRGDRDLGARREAEHADLPDTAPLEEVHGRAHVGRPVPPEAVRAPAAVAAPPLVVEQHAVAVAREHRRVQLEPVPVAAASVHEDDRCAVPRRDVPRGEPDPVGRPQCHVLVWHRERAHGYARLAGKPQRRADRNDGVVADEGPSR